MLSGVPDSLERTQKRLGHLRFQGLSKAEGGSGKGKVNRDGQRDGGGRSSKRYISKDSKKLEGRLMVVSEGRRSRSKKGEVQGVKTERSQLSQRGQ